MGNTPVAVRLAATRTQKGLSQRELARQSGISFGFISRIERGERSPSVETIRQLAETLGVSAYYLETGDVGGDLVYVQRNGA